MVKTIFLKLENKDFERLKKKKGNLSWEEFLIKEKLEE